MTFAHDTVEACNSVSALICSAEEPDTLQTIDDLTAFIEYWQYSGRHDKTQEELHAVRALRSRLRQFWTLDEPHMVELVNELLEECNAQPHLVRHEGWEDWHIHATRSEQPLAERLTVECAMAMVDIIRSGETERLRICAADDCDGVLVDLSRNRSRRYCVRGCGNRVHVKAYRERKSGPAHG